MVNQSTVHSPQSTVLKRRNLCFGFLFLWTVVCGLSTVFAAAGEQAEFQQANQAYRAGKFSEAAKIYAKLSEAHPNEPAFYFNLGNADYRLKSVGPAILAYERARLLAPRDPDINANLNFVRGLLEYRVADKRNWYLRAGEKFLAGFTFKEILFLFAVVYFIFAASWAAVLFFRRGMTWGWKMKTLLFCSLLFMMLSLAKWIQFRVISDAIVLAKEAQVRYGPSDTDQAAFRLGEGLKVYVLEEREDWSRILLPNGASGWVSNQLIGKVER